jgi:hypothetical protein
MPPQVLVRVINALIEGLMIQAALTPELIGGTEIRAAFAALACNQPLIPANAGTQIT